MSWIKNHIVWPPECPEKTRMCHMKVSFRTIWETWATPLNISCLWNEKVIKILVCLCIFNKHFWVKIKGTILFTNHFYLGWKENSLLDWLRSHGPWSFPEKLHDFNETAAAPKLLYYLFWIDHLRVGKSLFKRRTKVFSFYIISEMFRTNGLFVDLVAN